MDNEHQKAIKKSIEAVFERADARKKVGRNFFETDWQASLELTLLMMDKPLAERPGQMLPMKIDDQEEWEFYLDVLEKLDLPPETCAVFITPSAFKDVQLSEMEDLDANDLPVEREAYTVIISDLRDQAVVMQASLPGIEYAGIDVFEDGKQLADYSYNTVEECLDDLAKRTWIHFNPKAEWNKELITRYTENWYAKGLDVNLEGAPVHQEFSYIHHPNLLDLTPLESVFKVIGTTIPKEYDSLERAIEMTNDINRDMDLGEPVVTEKGILQDDKAECQALFNRITVEIDMNLENIDYLEGMEMPDRSIENIGYNRAFDETARKIYQEITVKSCPASVKLE